MNDHKQYTPVTISTNTINCWQSIKKTHVRLKSPYLVRNPESGFFSERVLGLISLWSIGAIMVGCPSWHHQLPWWNSNPRSIDHEPQALSTEPILQWKAPSGVGKPKQTLMLFGKIFWCHSNFHRNYGFEYFLTSITPINTKTII